MNWMLDEMWTVSIQLLKLGEKKKRMWGIFEDLLSNVNPAIEDIQKEGIHSTTLVHKYLVQCLILH